MGNLVVMDVDSVTKLKQERQRLADELVHVNLELNNVKLSFNVLVNLYDQLADKLKAARNRLKEFMSREDYIAFEESIDPWTKHYPRKQPPSSLDDEGHDLTD